MQYPICFSLNPFLRRNYQSSCIVHIVLQFYVECGRQVFYLETFKITYDKTVLQNSDGDSDSPLSGLVQIWGSGSVHYGLHFQNSSHPAAPIVLSGKGRVLTEHFGKPGSREVEASLSAEWNSD